MAHINTVSQSKAAVNYSAMSIYKIILYLFYAENVVLSFFNSKYPDKKEHALVVKSMTSQYNSSQSWTTFSENWPLLTDNSLGAWASGKTF